LLSLSIVIPAFNERERLPATIEAILSFVRAREWALIEILVVDDGSTDGTAEIVEQYQVRASAIRPLRNPGNRGKGYSVRHGMLEARADWALFTDADLSTPIGDFDILLKEVQDHHADIAIGSRALNPALIAVHQPALRELSGRAFNLVMRVITGLPFHDTQCGFKLYRTEAAREIFRRQRLTGFGFDVEDLFIARKLGYKAVETAVRWANAEGTKVRLTDGLKSFLDLVVIRWNQLRGRYKK
jgi:dolichyl-phosphate beta-glucosyltransferase